MAAWIRLSPDASSAHMDRLALKGKRFGRLHVLRRVGSSVWGKTTWLCRCDCGARTTVVGCSLVRGNTASCGCTHSEREDIATRFWRHVRKGKGKDACWIWTASLTRSGYGQFNVDGRPRPAHRIAWTLRHGAIPRGKLVLHDCPKRDNRRCVRHLFLGTQKDNAQDAAWKGRLWMQRHPERVRRGADSATSKLSHEQRRAICRAFYALRNLFALHYKVKQETILAAWLGWNFDPKRR